MVACYQRRCEAMPSRFSLAEKIASIEGTSLAYGVAVRFFSPDGSRSGRGFWASFRLPLGIKMFVLSMLVQELYTAL